MLFFGMKREYWIMSNKFELILLILKNQLKKDSHIDHKNGYKYHPTEIFGEVLNDIEQLEKMEEEELEEILIKRL
jgi:hypothetical protein